MCDLHLNQGSETKIACGGEEIVVDTRLKEEKNPCKMSDASTQTPKRRRNSGRASRMRRLLAFQLMLTKKRGLPKSRLLTLKEADAR